MSRKTLKAVSLEKLQGGLGKDWKDLQEKELYKRFKTNINFKALSNFHPLNKKQELFVKLIETSIMTIAQGPAGVGKDYVCLAIAARYLTEGKIDKIVLARPTVEVGNSIGLLPGTDKEKVRPYLNVMIDYLGEFLGEEKVEKLIEDGVIILSPLALMRGSNFKKAFIILDEAQNANEQELKMFCTRIANNSVVVLLADQTQSDLKDRGYGFRKFLHIVWPLIQSSDISLIRFTSDDIVRSGIVKKIVQAWEQYEEKINREANVSKKKS